MSKEDTRSIALQWKQLHGNFLAVPPGMYDGKHMYDGPVSEGMRNTVFPNLLQQNLERLHSGQNMYFVGIGSALDPECFPAIAALSDVHPRQNIHVYLQDPVYSYERGRQLVIARANEIGFANATGATEYQTPYGTTVYGIHFDGGSLRLDEGFFPQIQLPDTFTKGVVTLSNILNYVDFKDVISFLGRGNVSMIMIANTRDKGFVQKHPDRYSDMKGVTEVLQEQFGYETAYYEQQGNEEAAVLLR